MSSESTMTMPYDRALRELVFGKGGATVRQVQDDSGAKVRIDRDECTITAFGTQEAVDKVKAMYGDILARFNGRGFQMTVDRSMAPVIIGPRGATISGIQSSTDTIINVKDGRVTIRGSKEGQQAARAMIDDLIKQQDGSAPQQDRYGRDRPVRQRTPPAGSVSEVVEFPSVLSTNLTRRAREDNVAPVDRIKAEYPGIYSLDIDRRAGTITISGEQEAAAAGAKALASLIDGLKQKIGEMGPIDPKSVGLIIGSGGATISELQRRHRADINVSRDTQMVTIFCREGQQAVQGVIAEIENILSRDRLAAAY